MSKTKYLIAAVLPLVIGCATTPRQAQLKLSQASDFKICQGIYIGLPMNAIRYPELMFQEQKKRGLDCTPYKTILEGQLATIRAQERKKEQERQVMNAGINRAGDYILKNYQEQQQAARRNLQNHQEPAPISSYQPVDLFRKSNSITCRYINASMVQCD